MKINILAIFLLTVISCSNEYKKDKLIEPGVRVGEFYIEADYNSNNLQDSSKIIIQTKNNKISQISLLDSTYFTTKSIGVGDSKKQVLQAYGSPNFYMGILKSEQKKPIKIETLSYKKGIYFVIDENTNLVEKIIIFKKVP